MTNLSEPMINVVNEREPTLLIKALTKTVGGEFGNLAVF